MSLEDSAVNSDILAFLPLAQMVQIVRSPLFHPLTIVATVLHAFAILITAFRIQRRIHIRKFWWDDFWALVSWILDIILLVLLFARPAAYVKGIKSQLIAFGWLMPLVYTLVVWTTKISISTSITRILAPSTKTRKMSIAMTVSFFAMLCGVLIGKLWLCAKGSSWHNPPFIVICQPAASVTIFQLATDVVSSVALAVFPLLVLWHVDLPQKERVLILTIFSASILLTVCSTLHAVYESGPSDSERRNELSGFTGHFEAAISLMVCNLLVVVTRCYRVFRKDPEIVTVARTSISQCSRAAYGPTPTVFTDISFGGHTNLSTNTDGLTSTSMSPSPSKKEPP
ncbi:hypothetical protein C8J56DRAFT_423071 [Mycena floridula]|nr:hypothetical protein C8J56DRAFT_423071 [Mycena floridula]